MQSLTQPIPPELEEKIKDLAKPGVVFSEPVQSGEYTLITATRFVVHPKGTVANPVGVIVIGPKGVKVRRFRNAFPQIWMITMVAAIVFWSALIIHPPWREDKNLLEEVKELINTIRSR
jgi:hypothetical protein